MNHTARDLCDHLAELFALPTSGMTRIQITVEVRKAPTVDVSYLVVGPRAVSLAETHREQRGARCIAIRESYQVVPKDGTGDAPAFAPGPAAVDQVQRFEQAHPDPSCVNPEAHRGCSGTDQGGQDLSSGG